MSKVHIDGVVVDEGSQFLPLDVNAGIDRAEWIQEEKVGSVLNSCEPELYAYLCKSGATARASEFCQR